MNMKEDKICRLCLKLVEYECEVVDDITRDIFEVLLLGVNLEITKDPIVCKDCTDISIKCFDFKSVCIDTEEIIISFAVDRNGAAFQLQEAFKGVKETVDDSFVCRFCLNQSSGSNFVYLNSLKGDGTYARMLQELMPEMDLDVIKNPLICTSCRRHLECYIKFAENCFDVEEKITRYCQNEGTPLSGQVKLSEMVQFLLKNIVELDYAQMNAIKREEDGIEDIKEVDVEEHGVNFNTAYQRRDKDAPNEKKNDMLSSENVAKARIFKCALCIFQTNCKCSLTRHTLVHKNVTEAEMYKCLACTFQSKHKYNVKRHMLIHKDDTEVEMYKCATCPFNTKRKSYLKKHMLVHRDVTQVETHKCPICSYETKRKCDLKTHLLIHKDVTEVKMYKCSKCTYETRQKGNLKTHRLTHKHFTEVETYKCSTCTFQTKHKSSLKVHVLIHKRITEVETFKCSTCTYETKHKSGLKTHTLVHKNMTEVETYKCATCAYETKLKKGLKMHMLVHRNMADAEMFKCSVCIFQTKRKDSLKKHINSQRHYGGSV